MDKKEKLVILRDEYRKFLKEGRTDKATEIAEKMNHLNQEKGEKKDEPGGENLKSEDTIEKFKEIKGVGSELAVILQERFDRIENITKVNKEKLINIPGIGNKKAEEIRKESR